jgi:hypothetical protein
VTELETEFSDLGEESIEGDSTTLTTKPERDRGKQTGVGRNDGPRRNVGGG